MASPREIVRTESAPSAIGPYSQAVRLGGLLFLSGQIPLEPETGQLVTGSIEDQTRRVLENLSGVLRAAGSSLSRTVKTTIYLTSLGDFSAVTRRTFPPSLRPARLSKSPRCRSVRRSRST